MGFVRFFWTWGTWSSLRSDAGPFLGQHSALWCSQICDIFHPDQVKSPSRAHLVTMTNPTQMGLQEAGFIVPRN